MILLLSAWIFITSCDTHDRLLVEEAIQHFELNNLPDKREVVFHAEARFEKGDVVLLGETDDARLKNLLLAELEPYEVTDRITLLPDSTVGDTTFALVTVSVANLRARPSHSSELVSQALLGTPVKVLKKQKGWYLIQTPDKYISWVDAAGIHRLHREDYNRWKQSDRLILTVDAAGVFEDVYLQNPVADVSMGGILQLKERRSYVSLVAFPDGREGFIRSAGWEPFAQFRQSSRPDSVSIVNLARKLMGRPYLWGGTSAMAMDCSGFSKLVYYMHGIILARDASLQVRNGQPVADEASHMKFVPGDLLFFGNNSEDGNSDHITHVALSLGKTEYIHAAGRVGINSFDPRSDHYSAFRRNTFIGANRIIGTAGKNQAVHIKDHPWY